MARTDSHRLSKFQPEAYDYLFSYSLPSMGGAPGYNVALLNAVRTGETQSEPEYGFENGYPVITGSRPVVSPWGKVPFFKGGTGGCDCCGAWFIHGSVYRHRESGEAIKLGHICCQKAGIYTNDEWQAAYREKIRRMRASLRDRIALLGGLRIWARENRDLLDLLKVDHKITRSMRSKLITTGAKWGLSEKQVDLLKKLAEDAANPKPEEVKIAAPKTDERIRVEGTVVSIKEHESDYGFKLVMTIKVETDEGVWITWGTVPNSIIDEVERGAKVAFMAKIVVSDRDESFTFFKRPTKAEIVSAPAAAEESNA